MICPKCNTPIEEDTVFCGNCGAQVAPLYARGATVVEATEKMAPKTARSDPFRANAQSARSPIPPVSPPPAHFAPPTAQPERPVDLQAAPTVFTPAPPAPRRLNIKRAIFLGGLVVLLLIGVAIGGVALLKANSPSSPATTTNKVGGGTTVATTAGVSGLASFTDSQSGQHTAVMKISIVGLNAPPSGSHYAGWLIDQQNERITSLGSLTAQDKNFALDFAGTTNLLGQGDLVEITQEQGDVQLPTGKVVLSGKFPPEALVHIKHLLFAFPSTPGNIGLLVGLRDQARLLNSQATQLKQAASSGNQGSVRSIAQGMLDVLEGKNGPNARPLQGNVPFPNITETGDGFGLLGQGGKGYIATASAHASLAATQADSTDTIKLHAGHVIIAMTNIKGWLTTVDNDVQGILANPADTGKLQEIVTLSDHALNGVDINGDESIDPVPGEAGAITGYTHGQLMAGLTLHP